MTYAPIALFVYKRPEHTRRTIEALKRCPEFAESPVFVFSDGPRKPEGEAPVQETRAVARQALEDHAEFIEAPKNQGLAVSIIGGVTRLCEQFGRVIVVEDDLVVAPEFLSFLNAALDRYAHAEEVMQISGHMFPVPAFQDRSEALFLPFTTSWGWATWARAWQHFDPRVVGWERLESDPSLRHRFNVQGSFDYFGMLKQQLAGKVDSWAIRWNWSVFVRDGLVLYPPRTLVNNEGFDGSGTHGWRSARRIMRQAQGASSLPSLPDKLAVLDDEFRQVRQCLSNMSGGPVRKALKFVKSMFAT
jgi:hypothetical protein